MAFRIIKDICNGVEYLPPENQGGGGADTATVNALIDTKIGNYDSLFMSSPGLYKLLNDVTDEDELGLTGGDNRGEIVASQDSMNKISHGWTIMSMLACSNYALTTAIASNTALSELVASWVSMMVIANNTDAMEIIAGSSTAITAILGSAVAMDAILGSNTAMEFLLTSSSVSSSTYALLFANSTFATAVYNNDTYLGRVAENTTALDAFMDSSVWSSVLSNYDKLCLLMDNDDAASYIISNETSADLRADTPLRAIIASDKLDTYLKKDDRAYNGIITFDVNAISSTTFNVARYGYNGVTSTWKYSVDGGTWNSVSVAKTTSALSISLGSTGNHTVVIKPATYAVWRARQMGNGNTSCYWSNSPTALKFSVRNLPGYAFMASDSSYATNYFMGYMFYGCTALTGIDIKVPTGGTSAGAYYMSQMFTSCSNLTKISGTLLPSSITTVGTQFMYYMFVSCTNLTNLPKWLTFATITSSINTYFLGYFCYNCTKLKALPKGMALPSVGNSSYYLYYAFYGCSALNASAPTENLYFVNAASYCFTSSGISTASPSAGSNIAVHRE